jgi:hypothetical protein
MYIIGIVQSTKERKEGVVIIQRKTTKLHGTILKSLIIEKLYRTKMWGWCHEPCVSLLCNDPISSFLVLQAIPIQ